MKSIFLPTALLCSLAALAQEPVASTQHVYKYAASDGKHEAKINQHDQGDDAQEEDKAGPADNHGQTVQALSFTGPSKGAAVSALASNAHSTARREHFHGTRSSDHSARGERGHAKNTHHCGQQSGGHYGGH